jgi:HSP20 family protein
MRPTCYTPYRLIDQVHQKLERWRNVSPRTGETRSSRWAPAFDVLEGDDHYLLRADVPGVARNDIDIQLERSVLTIRAERKAERSGDSRGYRRRERRPGRFCRQFTLPDTVDSAGISARVSDGVLEISIPKQAAATLRKITLN